MAVLKSFEQLRQEVKLKPLKKRQEKPVKCRLCGKEMDHVAQNMWYCKNEVAGADGKAKICSNIYIRKGYR